MTLEDRDLRMLVVAFEDAVTWCESLAELADRLLSALRMGETLHEHEVSAAAAQLAHTRQYLRANEGAVQRIKARAGIG